MLFLPDVIQQVAVMVMEEGIVGKGGSQCVEHFHLFNAQRVLVDVGKGVGLFQLSPGVAPVALQQADVCLVIIYQRRSCERIAQSDGLVYQCLCLLRAAHGEVVVDHFEELLHSHETFCLILGA